MELSDLKDIRGESGRGIAAWVRWAVREKFWVYFMVIVLVVVGGIGISRMNKDEFPTFEMKQGLIAGIYPGASAAEVEEQLARPLEEYLFSFKEIERRTLKSVSRDGICYIYADLRESVPQSRKDEIWSKIKLGLQTRKATLPPEVLAVAVIDDFGNVSSMLLAIGSTDKGHSELREYAEDLCTRLRKLPNLAKAEILGDQTEEIAVTLDREKLSSYGIDPFALMLNYRSSSLAIPAGSFSTDYTESPIMVKAPVGSEMEVAERIVWSDPSGDVVRLRDVATIERRYKAPSQFVSYNGNSCLIVNVEMRPDNNIVAFGRDVDAVLQQFRSELPDSVTVDTVTDQPKVVKTSVWNFLRDLLIAILVVIVVMLMLFPMRSAIIASSGVPVCTAVAIGAMYLGGIPLNTVTLAALITCLGMIVDDSIITMDGYMNQLRRGRVGVDAASASARELFIPTFVATLAICLMFFPMTGIIDGYLGDFVAFFPWVVLAALMASLFYAVTVVPSLEVKFISAEEGPARKTFFGRVQDRFFDLLQHIYEWFLSLSFKVPLLAIAGGVAAIALGVWMFLQLNVQMMPKAEREYFVVEVYLESGNGISRTREVTDSLERLFLKDPRVKSVTSFSGTPAPRFAATYAPILPAPQRAQIIVQTFSPKATEELLRKYENSCEFLFPEAMLHFKQMDYQVVEAPLTVLLKGDDREAMYESAGKIKSYLSSLSDETKWVHSDIDDFRPGVTVRLDPDEAARLGVTKGVLSLSLAGTFGGETVATLWEGPDRIPVNIYSEGIGGGSPYSVIGDQIVNTGIPGVSVPLRQIATLSPEWEPAQLIREAGVREVGIYADLKYGVSQPEVAAKLAEFIDKEVELPEGVTLEWAGLSGMNDAVLPDIMWSFIAACAVLFLFLLIHFRKGNIALLTMALSSLCLFGASFGLWIFGLDFSITAVLGLISLVGIIVRNGILLFEYAEYARFEKGESVRDAAFQAGQRRMRPIFLTSLTTALGVLPMIISGDLLWMPMGVVICFGTLLSIFLITIMMPVTYWQLFKHADKKV